MNFTQINYFLTAARTLNFTDAAKELYISQPALSKQITAIENELNMMLFIRSNKKIRLTPAGAVLLKELPKLDQHYEEILHKARIANAGTSGELVIGILEGQMVGQKFTEMYSRFTNQYPNISVRLIRDSFSGLRKQLEAETIDLAITLSFDLASSPRFLFEELEICPAFAAISKSHPLANNLPTCWADLKGQTFIAIDPKDSVMSARMIEEDCKKAGFHPIIKYAPSLESAMLWIEAGMGIGFINSMNNLALNPDIIILNELPYKDTLSVMAWKKENINPAIALFNNFWLS